MNYKQVDKIVNGRELPLSGETGDEEPFIITKGRAGDLDYYKISVAQNNNWMRILYLYEDGTSEETYEQ